MIYVVMGVSGCGKSTVGEALARRLGGEFLDADPFHPPANVEKMAAGIPLTDADRAGWLAVLAGLLVERRGRSGPTVLACSALKESYRDRLRVGPEVRFVYLQGSFAVIEGRLRSRQGHFMKAGLLESQFAALEEPACGPGTDALALDLTLDPTTLVNLVLEHWNLQGEPMNTSPRHPPKVIQFGEGNFLRAFIDWMVQGLNDRADFDGSVLLSKTLPGPFAPAFADQDYRYHLVIRGRDGDRVVQDRHRIDSLGGTINAYEDFAGYLAAAANPGLRVIVSNTTEAGIAYDPTDAATDRPAKTYPGKLTQFLRARYEALGGGAASALALLPCELIEKNGQTLKKHVLAHADRWYQDPAFSTWLADELVWYDTLVDRIVPGHDPQERARCLAETGVDDQLLVVTEPYHIFVVQGPEREDLLPFRKAGFNVVWTDDLTPWRTRKVRILNGGHTFLAMVGLGLGVATVRESLEHPVLGPALDAFYARDVLPFMAFPADELKAYHATILDRFANPFVVHKLADIALNSVSKYISRILPGAQDVVARTGRAPRFAAFGLAALVDRYLHLEAIQDDAPVLARFRQIAAQTQDPAAQARLVFSSPEIWIQGAVLPPALVALATDQYRRIRQVGLEAALQETLAGGAS